MLGCIRRRSDLISLVILFVSFRFFPYVASARGVYR